MAIQYTMKLEGEVLLVTASGRDDNEEEVRDYGLAIIQEAIRLGCPRVLCDERDLQYNLDTLSNYEAAKFIAEVAPKVSRVAIVCRPQDTQSGEFWETVAVNRGLTVRMLTDIVEAWRWIGEPVIAPENP